jgi:lysyl-tRNA synthetase class 2
MNRLFDDFNEHIENRIGKVERLRELGYNPYPHKFERENMISEVVVGEVYKLAGRIMLRRGMGKSTFLNIEDPSGKIQLYINSKNESLDADLIKLIEVGDIIGVSGEAFLTKTEELTIRVNELSILTKSIRPLPDKFKGLTDPEARIRHRSLDMIMNPDVRNTLVNRAKAISAIRTFMANRGYLEMDTPILDMSYGGGEAAPFITNVNALSSEAYMNVSPELYLKRYIVGGIDKVYTFSRAFRNEGIDRTHYPEFTLFECYESYADYKDMMNLMEHLYEHVFMTVNGSTKATINGTEVDFKAPWKRVKMLDMVSEVCSINIDDEAAIRSYCEKNVETDCGDMTKGQMIYELFETFCEEKIVQPTFVIEYPYETSPLCKRHRDNDELIERFEPFVVGIELGNAYSELNDPVRQRELLHKQSEELRGGLETASPMDEIFTKAIDIGMPPTGGLGVGIDRLIMFVTGSDHIKDVIGFPMVKRTK